MYRRRSIDEDEMSLHIADFANDTTRSTDYIGEAVNRMLKRSPLQQEGVRQFHQRKSSIVKKANAVRAQPDVLTTVVTLTNTQLLPNDGDTIRTKTIRNLVKPMSDVEDDEDFHYIDSDAPPRVYITKILSKGEKTIESSKQPTKKPKMGKGERKKKNKKKFDKEATTVSSTQNRFTKKRKGKGLKRKHGKAKPRGNHTDTSEQTKSPRHLLTSLGLPHHTTPRPHQSSFLHGVIDPKDSHFTNKGQIRGYQMHIASRKPTPSARLSEETRILWEMDELNYTTHMTALKTTMMTELKRKHDEDTATISVVSFRDSINKSTVYDRGTTEELLHRPYVFHMGTITYVINH
ncbi:hypothetical protein KIN20_035693 [Parelaphostrongylus tenuis]|uniref:Uncharacterized protein n=1 Tax=Parelaphostrongylus tenuis TaxID=148309 RepID=A0AAD5RBL1_PARTN|nr:hypothetical protein KIN20_035693 [Parelaphostrongylus tenuis]